MSKKDILIKSKLEGIQTETGLQDISNTLLQIDTTKQDSQKVRVNTDLYVSETAFDNEALALTDKRLSNLPLNKEVFDKQIIVLVCEHLTAQGLEVENLTIRDHIWTHETQTIRVFMTDRQVQDIAFGEYYDLINYVHDNGIIKEINSIGTWLYLTTLLPEHQAILESIGAFIQTKDEFDAL